MFETLYRLSYLEIDMLALAILFWIVYKSRNSIDKQTVTIAFNRIVYSVIFLLIFEVFWLLIENKTSTYSIVLNNILNVLYMSMTGVIGVFWCSYVLLKINSIIKNKFAKTMLYMPAVLIIILSISSPWTKFIFYIDELGAYHRGLIHPLQLFISLGYVILSAIFIGYELKKERESDKRTELWMLYSFVICPVGGSILGFIFSGIPSEWPFVTLSLLMIFTDNQIYQISTDALTKLNNRHRFDQYLRSIFANKISKYALLMIDINDFKQINDKFGHLEGDAALIDCADILRMTVKNKNAFIARYGGDEFIIIAKNLNEEDAYKLKENILESFNNWNSTSSREYSISVSVGVVTSSPDMSPSELLKKADFSLYQEKIKIHKAN